MSGLRRDLGLLDAVAIGWGAIIGAGIFVVVGVAAGVAGPSLLVGLALAAAVAWANASSMARLAARFPKAGGAYEYGCELLHPAVGFAAGWLFVVSKLAAGGTVAIGFGRYLADLVPGVDARAAGVVAVAALVLANLGGIRKAGRLNLAIVSVTAGTLLAFIVVAAPAFRADRLAPFAPAGVRGVLESAALLFFAYTGYARIATLAEEVRDPERTIPRAIAWSLGTTVVLYFAIALAALGSVGPTALAAASSPLADAARLTGGAALGAVVSAGAATALLGVLLSQILGISRVGLAMARRGDLPAGLAHVSERRAVPDRAVWATGGVLAALAGFAPLEAAVAWATFSILAYYAVAQAAAWRLPGRGRGWAVFGLAGCVALMAAVPPAAAATGAGVALLGFAIRAAVRGAVRGRTAAPRTGRASED